MNAKNWSLEQSAIFNWFAKGIGNLIVMARAGTGKTTTIIEAFKHAVEFNILYAVFNKKNQLEAQDKITDGRVQVQTLHAVGFSIIKRNWGRFLKPDYYIEGQRVSQICPPMPDFLNWQVCKIISFLKNSCVSPKMEDILKAFELQNFDIPNKYAGEYTLESVAEIILKALELAKVKSNKISFDDMVWLPVAMDWCKPTFDLVAVDEAQDMSEPQLAMIQSISKGRICAVGDDKQAIYGFRGAYENGLQEFKTRLNAQVLPLTTTYRCPKGVVEMAKQFCPDYVAHDSNSDGQIEETTQDKLGEVLNVGDAVLSRKNAPLMPLCLSLLRDGKTARIEGRDIGQMLAKKIKHLEIEENAEKPFEVRFCEAVAIWRATQVAKTKNPASIQTIDDTAETLCCLSEGMKSCEDIAQRINDIFIDSNRDKKPAIILSTVHKAKGLEFNTVYCLKSSFMLNRGGQETNIYYVALTRTKDKLVMVN